MRDNHNNTMSSLFKTSASAAGASMPRSYPTTPPKRHSPRSVLENKAEVVHAMFTNFFSCRRFDNYCSQGTSSLESSPSLSLVDMVDDNDNIIEWKASIPSLQPSSNHNLRKDGIDNDYDYNVGGDGDLSSFYRNHSYSQHKDQRESDDSKSQRGRRRTRSASAGQRTSATHQLEKEKKKKKKSKKLIRNPPRIQRLNLGSGFNIEETSKGGILRQHNANGSNIKDFNGSGAPLPPPVELEHTPSLKFLFVVRG